MTLIDRVMSVNAYFTTTLLSEFKLHPHTLYS
jgi:hypothetical protein